MQIFRTVAAALAYALYAAPCYCAFANTSSTSGCAVQLDVQKTIQWWSTVMSCKNGTITNCPAGKCPDTEFMARSLAFGGAITLKPNDPAGVYCFCHLISPLALNCAETCERKFRVSWVRVLRDGVEAGDLLQPFTK